MRWAYVGTGLPSVTVIEASDPGVMTAQIAAAMVAIIGVGGQVITAIELGGAGDGYAFTLRIEYCPSGNAVPILTIAAPPPTSLTGGAYMAADATELAAARARAIPGLPPGFELACVEMAGSSKGHRFCVAEFFWLLPI